MTLKVIGAGWGRTATNSLKVALEMLGFGPCYHMFEVRDHPHFAEYWAAKAAGKTVDWDEVFAGYNSAVDWPVADYYAELAAYYPRAKIILSVRDPEDWFESTQKTIFNEELRTQLNDPRVPAPRRRMLDKIYNETLKGGANDRDTAVALFRAHNEEVERKIPPDRLLVYPVGAGWQPLCDFLGVPVPDTPYPRTNTREDFGAKVKEWRARSEAAH